MSTTVLRNSPAPRKRRNREAQIYDRAPTPPDDGAGCPDTEPEWRAHERERVAEIMFQPVKFEPEEFPSPDSLQERIKRQRATFLWVLDQNMEFFVTIKFNERLSHAALWDRLKKFDALLNRHCLGPGWLKKPSAERVFFVAFPEQDRANDGVHVHLLMRRPRTVQHPIDPWRLELFSKTLTKMCCCKGVCPHGDVKVQDVGNEVAIASYTTKDFYKRESEMIISSEFHPR